MSSRSRASVWQFSSGTCPEGQSSTQLADAATQAIQRAASLRSHSLRVLHYRFVLQDAMNQPPLRSRLGTAIWFVHAGGARSGGGGIGALQQAVMHLLSNFHQLVSCRAAQAVTLLPEKRCIEFIRDPQSAARSGLACKLVRYRRNQLDVASAAP